MSKHYYTAVMVRVEKAAKSMPKVSNLGAAANKDEMDKVFFKAMKEFHEQENKDESWVCVDNYTSHLSRSFSYRNKKTGEKVTFKLHALMSIWED